MHAKVFVYNDWSITWASSVVNCLSIQVCLIINILHNKTLFYKDNVGFSPIISTLFYSVNTMSWSLYVLSRYWALPAQSVPCILRSTSDIDTFSIIWLNSQFFRQSLRMSGAISQPSSPLHLETGLVVHKIAETWSKGLLYIGLL